MRTKERLQGFVAGIITACVLLAALPVIAATFEKTITVTYKDIKLYVDGDLITPKDGSGNVVEPFVYDGTTYLPVRAVGEAIGKHVTWDSNTNSVYLGTVPNLTTNWMKQLAPYEYGHWTNAYLSEKGETFVMAGKTYTDGIVFLVPGPCFILYNLDGQYSSLTFDIGHVDETYIGPAELNVYLDGNLAQTVELDGNALPQTITVPLNYASQLKLEMKASANYGSQKYGLSNGIFEK